MTGLLRENAPAPDFELEGSDHRRHRLSEVLAEGPAMLVFYPGNDTPG